MPEYKSLRIEADAFEEHKERKEKLGMTWTEYMDDEAPELQAFDLDDIRRTVREEMGDGGVDLVAIQDAAREGAKEGFEEMHR